MYPTVQTSENPKNQVSLQSGEEVLSKFPHKVIIIVTLTILA